MQHAPYRTRWYFGASALIALTFSLARTTNAQAAGGGRIAGIVMDSVRSRPLAGVRVVAVGVGDQTSIQRSAISDSAGRYRIDSIPAGRYSVGFESPLLDSLEITLSPREATVADGGAATVDLALPPAAKLRAAVCPDVALAPGTGAIIGHVVSTENESSLRGVVISMEWREMSFDKATMRPSNRERTASVVTDDAGWYRVCGVPTGAWLAMQLEHAGRTGSLIRTLVDDTLGLAVRHLSFSATSSRASERATTTTRDDSADAPLSGTAKLNGVVLGTAGAPIAQVDVRVRGTNASTRTDAQGNYTLAGLPAGTQMLLVRHVGYAIVETSVDLREGMTTTSNVRLRRIVSLDSMRVVATRDRYPEFARNKRFNVFGRYLGPDEIQRQRVAFVSDIIEKLPGFRVVGTGHQAKVVDAHGVNSFMMSCPVNVVIDGGAEYFEINDLPVSEIGAIEAYPAGPFGPQEFHSGCGLIQLWTKR